MTVDALLARTNAGTLDEAIRGLERKRKVHVMGGADPLIRLIRGAWDLYQGKPASEELVMFASWEELKAAARGQKDGAPGDPALLVLVRLIKDRDRRVLQMCRQLEACVESPAAAQITVSTPISAFHIGTIVLPRWGHGDAWFRQGRQTDRREPRNAVPPR